MSALLLFFVQLLQAMGAPIGVTSQGAVVVVHQAHPQHGTRSLSRSDVDDAPYVDGLIEPSNDISNGF